MKKRSLKLVLSLILAMTMVMGMGMSVMAATYDSGTVDFADLQPGDVLEEGVTITNNSNLLYVRCRECKIATQTTWDDYETVTNSWLAGSHSEHYVMPGNIFSNIIGFTICDADGNVPTPESPSSDSEPAKPSEPAKTEIEVREALEETMPVSPVSVDATQFNKADVAVIPGGTYNLSNFITTKGIVKGINAAVAASNKAGSNTVTIYSGRPFCFNGEILKAIQTGKKDVTYFFNYQGHLYSVTIPATVDAAKVLEKAGFAGPFYVGQQLGTTVLVK